MKKDEKRFKYRMGMSWQQARARDESNGQWQRKMAVATVTSFQLTIYLTGTVWAGVPRSWNLLAKLHARGRKHLYLRARWAYTRNAES